MKSRFVRYMKRMQQEIGARSWSVLRSRTHYIVEFEFENDEPLKVSVSASPGDRRSHQNLKATVRRKMRVRRYCQDKEKELALRIGKT